MEKTATEESSDAGDEAPSTMVESDDEAEEEEEEAPAPAPEPEVKKKKVVRKKAV